WLKWSSAKRSAGTHEIAHRPSLNSDHSSEIELAPGRRHDQPTTATPWFSSAKSCKPPPLISPSCLPKKYSNLDVFTPVKISFFYKASDAAANALLVPRLICNAKEPLRNPSDCGTHSQ